MSLRYAIEEERKALGLSPNEFGEVVYYSVIRDLFILLIYLGGDRLLNKTIKYDRSLP